ncbi:helix-turn-helix transcriptional regulator [Agromyces sp. SYSU T0242]|uniref:helix-turn-helix transcriptional regulator n=1 Tax=Agromyces litoreus TaxID=3158561 RepID=UPI0033984B54
MVGLTRSAIHTTDPEAARRAFEPMVPRLEFGRVDPADFRVQLRFDVAASFSVIEYAFSAPAATVAGSDDIVVISARGRGFELRHGRHDVDTSRPYLQTPDAMAARWQAVAARAVMLARPGVEAIARTISGDPGFPLAFSGLEPRSPALGRHWEQTVHRVRTAMTASPEAFDEPVVEQAAFHRLAVAYLHAFQVVWLDPMRGEVAVGARSAVVRAAVEYMQAHAADPITVQHVADAVHISARGLHAAFRAELGVTPSEHLRGIRLEGVHDELSFAAPGEGVSTIARRWGFVHLSRFAAAYRGRYGRLPSETAAARA